MYVFLEKSGIGYSFCEDTVDLCRKFLSKTEYRFVQHGLLFRV